MNLLRGENDTVNFPCIEISVRKEVYGLLVLEMDVLIGKHALVTKIRKGTIWSVNYRSYSSSPFCILGLAS